MKPMLFNTEMVRALLSGTKTQTRRVIKPKYRAGEAGWNVVTDLHTGAFCYCEYYDEYEESTRRLNPPCFPGDILYVRETWATTPNGQDYLYKADSDSGGAFIRDKRGTLHCPRWHPSIHMPKEAARIFLLVTEVRVEKLQEIMDAPPGPDNPIVKEGCAYGCDFIAVWENTTKPADRDSYGWDANPWVWVISFERCERPEEV